MRAFGAVRPAGLRVLVPGWAQWRWGQPERAAALGGTYLSAVGVGLFAWGTLVGWGMLALAVLVHVASVTDAIRQRAFPGFGRWVPVLSASAGLGLAYLPALGVLGNVAWPAGQFGIRSEGFLVNRWAYRELEPQPGHWVWFDRPAASGTAVGRLWAHAAQEVEWLDGRLRIDGQPVDWQPVALGPGVRHLLLRVPSGHVVVEPLGEGDPPWLILPESAVRGRAWAQHRPIWERRVLP